MLTTISAALGSLNAAKDIVKGLDAVRTATSINDVKIELQGLILDAQQGLFDAQQAQTAATDRIRELEQKLMELENWEAEKQRYELADAGQGTLAYRPKAGVEDSEPPHWLCPNCYQSRKKSLLQSEKRVPGMNSFLCCPACKTELLTRGHINTVQSNSKRR